MKCFACKREIPAESVVCPSCGEPQGFDLALIEAARAGDQGAVSELYRRTYENVYYTVRALIRDEDTVLDLVQDTFVKAFENLDKLHEPSKFRAWVKRIGHNLAVDYTRRSRPLLFSQMSDEDEETVLSFPDEREENLPDVALDRRETTRLINEILGSLSEDQRLVVGMFYYEQRSVREIAAELGVSENTVKSRLFQGRKKIETRVKALEAQGTRLYSLTPTAFLLLLLRNQELFAPPIPAEGLLSAVLGDLGLSAEAASAGSGAAAAELAGRAAGRGAAKALGGGASQAAVKAAGAGVKAAGKALALKITAIVAASAVVVGGGAYALHTVVTNRAPEPEPEAVQIIEDNPWAAAPAEDETPPAEALPAEAALTDEERVALNRFLSSFAEWPRFDTFSYNPGSGDWIWTRDQLVDYAFWTVRFGQSDAIGYEGDFYTVRLDTVNALLERRFGFSLTEADAENFTQTNLSDAHYAGGAFYFPASDGDCYNRLSLVREIAPREDGSYELRFDLYYLDFDVYEMMDREIPSIYYDMTPEESRRRPELIPHLSGQAVVRRVERDGQTDWQLLSYSLGELDPGPLGQLDPALREAYLRQLQSRQADILYFEGTMGGVDVPSVALCDLTGDGVPELLYATSQWGAGGAFLWIYRYEDGEAVKCGQYTWETETGQERLTCLFQLEGEPTLYAEYTDFSSGPWSNRVLRFDPDGAGGFRQTPFAREQSFQSGANPEYFFDGRAYPEEEYWERMEDFYSRVSRVLIFDQKSLWEGRVNGALVFHTGEGLSYQEAVELLQGS